MDPPGHAPPGDADRPHVPVMVDDMLELAAPTSGCMIVDGTFGAGGHAEAFAPRLLPDGRYVAVDRDPSAATHVAKFEERWPGLAVRFLAMPYPDAFVQLEAAATSADVVMLDVGVSSMQLDRPERGFSYMHDAPLDMRMDPTGGPTAADLVNEADERELVRVLRSYGEERSARGIARSIIRRRERQPISTTHELVSAVRGGLPAGGRATPGGHPAKRTFQALRIAVNDELGMLDRGLDAAWSILAPGGRLVVLSFHSLEDRIVKRRFEAWSGRCSCPPGLPVCACGEVSIGVPLGRGLRRPSADEVARNPRAASTRLRGILRRPEPVPIVGMARS